MSFAVSKVFKIILRQRNRLLAASTLAVFVFLLAGGFDWASGVLFGCTSITQYNNTLLAPLFGGFLISGVFGLIYTYKHRDSGMCLFGLLITLFSYGVIEWLYGLL